MIEGKDYILEDGYVIFTRSFLLERGQCCYSGCRNCPYDKEDKYVSNKERPQEFDSK